MRILMFNHHPDVTHYMWRAFTELGHKVELASEKLTYKMGFKYSSTKENKFEVVDQLFEPGELFPDMKNALIVDNLTARNDQYLFWGMLPEVTSLRVHGVQTWYDCQMQGTLRNPQIQALPGIKTSNHPDSADFNFAWVPNWVDKQPDLIEPTYITQLITELNLVATTPELIRLRDAGLPVKIHGGKNCPDGFIRDINILPYTALLVHNKDFGCNCYAVCKALDMGIPVYMSRKTKTRIGFDDLPDMLFKFSEDTTIERAANTALKIHRQGLSKKIQTEYRSIYTLERTVSAVAEILDKAGIPA